MKRNNDTIKATIEATDKLANEYRLPIEFFVFKEGEVLIAYCPSLDLSSSGTTFNEAVANLREALGLFIECSMLSA